MKINRNWNRLLWLSLALLLVQTASVLGSAAVAKLQESSASRRRVMSVPGTPVQGTSAFVYVEPESGALQLFDFVSVNERSAGFKVHL